MIKIDNMFNSTVDVLFHEMTWGDFERQYPDANVTLKVTVEEVKQQLNVHEFLISEVVGIKITITKQTHTYYLDKSEVKYLPQLNWRDNDKVTTDIQVNTLPKIRRICG
jgi:hypothetical protein